MVMVMVVVVMVVVVLLMVGMVLLRMVGMTMLPSGGMPPVSPADLGVLREAVGQLGLEQPILPGEALSLANRQLRSDRRRVERMIRPQPTNLALVDRRGRRLPSIRSGFDGRSPRLGAGLCQGLVVLVGRHEITPRAEVRHASDALPATELHARRVFIRRLPQEVLRGAPGLSASLALWLGRVVALAVMRGSKGAHVEKLLDEVDDRWAVEGLAEQRIHAAHAERLSRRRQRPQVRALVAELLEASDTLVAQRVEEAQVRLVD
eukprot:scaffold757_cov246-Pinguiococcus_pyrenoidosus.AAC.36